MARNNRENNQLFVPVFQREYVWKRENVNLTLNIIQF